jgi:pimeloyl-ACP methyl ester carboxylesterase
LLSGLWFGDDDAKSALIFVHGLGSNVFSGHKLITPLANKEFAVIFFNNRGHDKVSRIRKIDNRKKRGTSSILAGEAFEIFTDCVDDVQGAVNFLKGKGVQNIFLAGHSTGCQKSVYYLSKKGKEKNIKGLILLCPVSDYAGSLKMDKNNQLVNAWKYADRLIKNDKAQELIPMDFWPGLQSAQRFISLYTPDSLEEIFSYCQPNKDPKILKKIKVPTLLVFAEKDEYRDRPMKKIEKWFFAQTRTKDLKSVIIPDALHSFYQKENLVSEEINKWISIHQ